MDILSLFPRRWHLLLFFFHYLTLKLLKFSCNKIFLLTSETSSTKASAPYAHYCLPSSPRPSVDKFSALRYRQFWIDAPGIVAFEFTHISPARFHGDV